VYGGKKGGKGGRTAAGSISLRLLGGEELLNLPWRGRTSLRYWKRKCLSQYGKRETKHIVTYKKGTHKNTMRGKKENKS